MLTMYLFYPHVIFVLIGVAFLGESEALLCQSYVSLDSAPSSQKLNRTIECSYSCFTSWTQEDPTHITILQQGCMGSPKDRCLLAECRLDGQSPGSSHKFCCCSTDQCNVLENKGVNITFRTYQTSNLSPPVFRSRWSSKSRRKPDINRSRDQSQDNYGNSVQTNVKAEAETTGVKNDKITCAFYEHQTNQDAHGVKTSETSIAPSVHQQIECTSSCFTLWSYEENNNTESFVIIKQGCFHLNPEDRNCHMEVCKPSGPSKSIGHYQRAKFCCCYGNMCNINFTDVDDGEFTTPDVSVQASSHLAVESYFLYKEKTIIISLVSVFSVSLIVMGTYLLYRICLASNKHTPSALDLVEAPPLSGFQSEDLKISSLICKTKNGEVWKGTLSEIPVAIKIFTPNHKHLYQNEKYIYSLPFIEHENLLKFYGTDERQMVEGFWQYMIVLSYVPRGSLFGYLKNNTVDWEIFCKMTLSIARGLTHLHTDCRKGDLFKPTVAHRDLNTRNILVREDLSCVIGDLGYAITTMGSKLIRNGQYENAEQASLQDVGTLRYMAPELLDGAANLRESEGSLKQIDVYSLGLVLWEVATRCADLYHGLPVPNYQLPYEREAGLSPSFEEMQILVSRNKIRPKFPEVWRDYNQAVRALKDTIEDCWDHDSEARLTAVCVKERILDMMMLWAQDSKQKGLTPTITTTSNLFPDHTDVDDTVKSSVVDNIPVSDNSTASLVINSPPNVSTDPIQRPSSWCQQDPTQRPASFVQQGLTSSGSTTETLIAVTPSEVEPPPVKLLNVTMAKNNVVLHAHQGRNPTVERNTHKKSDEELAVSGNKLIYNNNSSSAPSLTDDILETFNDSLETSLVQRDVLNHHRNPPIPHLQNQVTARPKVANVPQNYPQNATQSKLKNLIRVKDFGSKLSQLALFAKKASKSHKMNNKKCQKCATENTNLLQDLRSQLQKENTGVNESSQNPNTLSHLPQNWQDNVITPVQTEVRVHNGTACVRPTQILADDNSVRNLYTAEVGVAKLKIPQHSCQQSVIQKANNTYSKSNDDLDPGFHINTFLDDSLSKLRRPNSLSLRGHNYKIRSPKKSNTCESLALLMTDYKSEKQDNSSEKIKRRIKTPVSVKHGRFSLYDDRLMAHYFTDSPDLLEKATKSCQLERFGGDCKFYITAEQSC